MARQYLERHRCTLECGAVGQDAVASRRGTWAYSYAECVTTRRHGGQLRSRTHLALSGGRPRATIPMRIDYTCDMSTIGSCRENAFCRV